MAGAAAREAAAAKSKPPPLLLTVFLLSHFSVLSAPSFKAHDSILIEFLVFFTLQQVSSALKIAAPARQPAVEAAPNLPHFGFDFM